MKGVLADTSVWVDHFRRRNDALASLLERDLVLTHPLIVGEIACGTPPQRSLTLASLSALQSCRQATVREVVDFIEREHLFGLGCGLADLLLLASTLMTPGVELWTLDRRLSAMAERFGVMYRPAPHADGATTRDGPLPSHMDRALEARLLDLVRSGSTRPEDWRREGPAYFMAGLAVALASAPEFNRKDYLALAEALHPGASELRVFDQWLKETPWKRSRFMAQLRG